MVAGAFIGNILLGGYNFSWKAAEPKASRMNPLKGLKRIFGLQSIIELLKSVAKFGVVTLVSYVLLAWQFPKIVTLSEGLLPGIFIDAIKIVGMIFILLICSLIIVVVIDVPYQLYNHHKQLKMTKRRGRTNAKCRGQTRSRAKMRSMQPLKNAHLRRMMQDVPKRMS